MNEITKTPDQKNDLNEITKNCENNIKVLTAVTHNSPFKSIQSNSILCASSFPFSRPLSACSFSNIAAGTYQHCDQFSKICYPQNVKI